MSASVMDVSWGVQEIEPVRLRSLKSGLRRVQRELRRCSSDPSSACLAKLDDYVKCLHHEIRFLEDYPPDAIGSVQEERLEHLCHSALAMLEQGEDKHVLMVRDAFRKLLALVVQDFDRIRRSTVR